MMTQPPKFYAFYEYGSPGLYVNIESAFKDYFRQYITAKVIFDNKTAKEAIEGTKVFELYYNGSQETFKEISSEAVLKWYTS